MIKDLNFTFPGFTGTTGSCHLRVAMKSTEKKMVIVCSQYKNYYGTSVTNAVETIAEKFFYDVAHKRISDIEIPNLSENTIIYSKTNSFEKLLIKLKLLNEKRGMNKIYLNTYQLFNNVIWIERYPIGAGLKESVDDYMLVQLDEKFHPQWVNKISEEFINKETGFSLSELLVDSKELDFKTLKTMNSVV